MLVLEAQTDLEDVPRHKLHTKYTYGQVVTLVGTQEVESSHPQHQLLFFSLIATQILDFAVDLT